MFMCSQPLLANQSDSIRPPSLTLTTVLVSLWQPQDNCRIHWGQKKKASNQFACKCFRQQESLEATRGYMIPSYPPTPVPKHNSFGQRPQPTLKATVTKQCIGTNLPPSASCYLHWVSSTSWWYRIRKRQVLTGTRRVEEIWWNSSIRETLFCKGKKGFLHH